MFNVQYLLFPCILSGDDCVCPILIYNTQLKPIRILGASYINFSYPLYKPSFQKRLPNNILFSLSIYISIQYFAYDFYGI